MKTIEINYKRKVNYCSIIEVEDDIAEKALALDGEDLRLPRGPINADEGFYLITETLVDEPYSVVDSADEIENLSVTIYNPKN